MSAYSVNWAIKPGHVIGTCSLAALSAVYAAMCFSSAACCAASSFFRSSSSTFAAAICSNQTPHACL